MFRMVWIQETHEYILLCMREREHLMKMNCAIRDTHFLSRKISFVKRMQSCRDCLLFLAKHQSILEKGIPKVSL